MIILSDWQGYQSQWAESVVTLGDFDGIHLGHRELLKSTIEQARNTGRAAILVTYDPSPKKVLKKKKYDSQIYTQSEKIAILQHYELDMAVFLPFDEKMARFSAATFLQEILIKTLKARHIIIGYDHHFGFNRRGNYRYLKAAAKKYNFEVNRIDAIEYKKEQPVSSTSIRALLRLGKVAAAKELLGYPFMIRGTVIHGMKRGRKIGVPTANIHISPDKVTPKEGVYYAIARYGNRDFKAMVNIGHNPTFDNDYLTVEAHLLDFDEDIYGEILCLFFMERIRDEIKFSSIDNLISQIKADIELARTKPLKDVDQISFS